MDGNPNNEMQTTLTSPAGQQIQMLPIAQQVNGQQILLQSIPQQLTGGGQQPVQVLPISHLQQQPQTIFQMPDGQTYILSHQMMPESQPQLININGNIVQIPAQNQSGQLTAGNAPTQVMMVTSQDALQASQNSELLTLTYGSLVSQMLRDFENVEDVNKRLERVGYKMGMRLIEDFLARTSSGRCLDMKETADKIQQAFRMYLNIQPAITNWSASQDEFSLIFDNNPLTEFVELPPDAMNLRYSGILCGCIRGALEMVQLEVQCWFVQDQLKGDSTTELRVKFIRRLEDAIPAGED